MIRKIIICVTLALSVVGCVSPSPNMKQSQVTNTAPAVKADKALVYFIRPNHLGWAINAAVYDDKTFIGFVPYNQKLPYYAEPGEHVFSVVSEAADFLKADLAAGKTYYIDVQARMGVWRARFSLAPVTAADLQNPKMKQSIDEAQVIENKPSASEWAESNKASVEQKQKDYYEKWMAKPESERPSLSKGDGI